jgi:hypothetical protein
MTLKRSGNFMALARRPSQRDRISAVCIFSFRWKLGSAALIKVVQAKIEKISLEIG